MSDPIETEATAELVEGFVSKTLSDAEKYSNSEPMDESNIFSLHVLAARIYADGYLDGQRVARRTESRAYNRRLNTIRATAKAATTHDPEDSE